MKTVGDLLDENVIQILSYLRATDLAAVRASNQRVFSSKRVHEAIEMLMKEVYNLPSQSPVKKVMLKLYYEKALKRPDYLYSKELFNISTALSSQPPVVPTSGYWISTTWLSNAKKYYESVPQPDMEVSSSKTPTKKKAKGTKRKDGEGVIQPWSSMTQDILCAHGGLALSNSNPRSKRRVITPRMWHFLRRFYPDGPELKCAYCSDCVICRGDSLEAKAVISEKTEAVISERRLDLVPDVLVALSARKSGVPMHCVTSRVAFYSGMIGEEDTSSAVGSDEASALAAVADAAWADLGGDLQQPLVPGLYNLVPRKWLKEWRHYVKDAAAPALPHLDCTPLVCQAHSQLVIPPHLEEYLIGLRRGLLAGLGMYPGVVAEILSADEWDALQDVFRGTGDYSVRFCLDGSGVHWNMRVCTLCDPFTYHPLMGKEEKKKNGKSPQIVFAGQVAGV